MERIFFIYSFLVLLNEPEKISFVGESEYFRLLVLLFLIMNRQTS